MDLVTNAETMLAKAISKAAISKSTHGSDAPEAPDQQAGGSNTETDLVSNSNLTTHGHPVSNVDVYEGPTTSVPPAPGFKSAFMAPVMSGSARDVSKGDGRDDYQVGGFWAVSWFQRVLVFTLIRLVTFVKKIFEDYDATKTYRSTNQFYSFLLALASLALPTIVYMIYCVGRYLQTVVFSREDSAINGAQNNSNMPIMDTSLQQRMDQIKTPIVDTDNNEYADARTRAPTLRSDQIDEQIDENGLVTARQSPITLAEARTPSPNIAEITRMMPTPSPAPTVEAAAFDGPTRVIDEEPRMSPVEIDTEVGASPEDRQSMGVLFGALTHLVHGLMYVFWQIKRQVDLIAFLCERCCVWRKPRETEQSRFDTLSRHSDGLEFFEDFYAGFLGVLVQITLIVRSIGQTSNTKLTAATQNSIANTAGSGLANGGPEGISISQAARTITSTIGSSVSDDSNHDILLTSELIVSLLVIASLLAAVRRRDDGYLTFTLSFIGWGSIFASRLIILSITSVLIHFWILIPVLVHIAGVTYWIYTISIDSHNDVPSENLAVWQEEENIELGHTDDTHVGQSQNSPPRSEVRATDRWSISRHVTLIVQIVALFSIPSLFYWPIMFQLKLHYRVFKYLTLILAENLIMMLLVLFGSWAQYTDQHRLLTACVAVLSIVGFFFITSYTLCKPSLTEHFARQDQLCNEAQSCGIYYDFCQRVFKLPDVTDRRFTRLLNQEERD